MICKSFLATKMMTMRRRKRMEKITTRMTRDEGECGGGKIGDGRRTVGDRAGLRVHAVRNGGRGVAGRVIV